MSRFASMSPIALACLVAILTIPLVMVGCGSDCTVAATTATTTTTSLEPLPMDQDFCSAMGARAGADCCSCGSNDARMSCAWSKMHGEGDNAVTIRDSFWLDPDSKQCLNVCQRLNLNNAVRQYCPDGDIWKQAQACHNASISLEKALTPVELKWCGSVHTTTKTTSTTTRYRPFLEPDGSKSLKTMSRSSLIQAAQDLQAETDSPQEIQLLLKLVRDLQAEADSLREVVRKCNVEPTTQSAQTMLEPMANVSEII